jgi:hypothetical protein
VIYYPKDVHVPNDPVLNDLIHGHDLSEQSHVLSDLQQEAEATKSNQDKNQVKRINILPVHYRRDLGGYKNIGIDGQLSGYNGTAQEGKYTHSRHRHRHHKVQHDSGEQLQPEMQQYNTSVLANDTVLYVTQETKGYNSSEQDKQYSVERTTPSVDSKRLGQAQSHEDDFKDKIVSIPHEVVDPGMDEGIQVEGLPDDPDALKSMVEMLQIQLTEAKNGQVNTRLV